MGNNQKVCLIQRVSQTGYLFQTQRNRSPESCLIQQIKLFLLARSKLVLKFNTVCTADKILNLFHSKPVINLKQIKSCSIETRNRVFYCPGCVRIFKSQLVIQS